MAGAKITVIGRAARVVGRLTGDGDLEVQGFVDGEIAVGGDVTVDAQGLVAAGVRGRRLVVRGAVKGDLTAEESILLESGARVVGDLRAPRVAIAAGALARGHVESGAPDGAVPAARRPQSVARPVAAPARAAAPSAPRAVAVSSPRPAAKPEAAGAEASRAANANGHPRRPPPPVVPALKKMKGQILKKKER